MCIIGETDIQSSSTKQKQDTPENKQFTQHHETLKMRLVPPVPEFDQDHHSGASLLCILGRAQLNGGASVCVLVG